MELRYGSVQERWQSFFFLWINLNISLLQTRQQTIVLTLTCFDWRLQSSTKCQGRRWTKDTVNRDEGAFMHSHTWDLLLHRLYHGGGRGQSGGSVKSVRVAASWKKQLTGLRWHFWGRLPTPAETYKNKRPILWKENIHSDVFKTYLRCQFWSHGEE